MSYDLVYTQRAIRDIEKPDLKFKKDLAKSFFVIRKIL
jgi:hypothetical protein